MVETSVGESFESSGKLERDLAQITVLHKVAVNIDCNRVCILNQGTL